ncbi:MAG: ribosomal RNA small subunit methyltransferase A [Calditrichaeota bacterium]|nr:ribosomal RNA small subunit methyltransferase A [Calditrichota bacterium]MCB9366844.1 ribosomal RNA small subunit methyltransferase A [Calditrichota bacterium]
MKLPPLPKKSLGQCFLTERSYAHEIVAALQIRPGDTVVEVGPGRGFLTELLVETPARVIAIEIDDRLQVFLKEKFARNENFSLVHSDFMDYDLSNLTCYSPLKVVGNLPYHLSSGIVYKLLEHNRAARNDSSLPWFSLGVLMMQREVAERMVAGSGSRVYGKLSVFVQAEAETTMHVIVPASAFRPTPQVDGGVVRMEFLKLPEHYPTDYKLFERIVRFVFSQRRKMLKSTLSQLAGIHPHWQRVEFDFTRRPETLSVGEWCGLVNQVARQISPRGS